MRNKIACLLLLALAAGLLGGCEYRGSVDGSVEAPAVTARAAGSPAPGGAEDGRMGPDTPTAAI